MTNNSAHEPLVNILTRTSNRPNYFADNVKSIKSQTYKNINHIVCTDDINSVKYIEQHGIDNYLFLDKDEIISKDPLRKKNPFIYKDGRSTGRYSPHNLYCNDLIDQVQDGWIIYLDDDDSFMTSGDVEEIVNLIKSNNEDTLIYWQMTRVGRDVLPIEAPMPPKLAYIGSPCMTFHAKYKHLAEWDGWKCGDFRVIERLHEKIPNKVWMEKSYIRVAVEGLGDRRDKK